MLDPPPLPSMKGVRLGSRRAFPTLAPWAFLNHAAVSPLSRPAMAALAEMVNAYARGGLAAVPLSGAQRRRLKGHLATLLGASPEDIGLTANTGAGLRAVALCFPWQPGDRVVVFEGEFPSNVTPWQQAARVFDLRVQTLSLEPFARPDGADLGPLEEALRRGVRLVALSAVQFQTGLRLPIDAIGGLCRRYGAALCVDAAQACGLAPLLAHAADFVAAPGHKWLMGPEGTGFLFVHPDYAPRLRPTVAGWLSHESPVDFLFAPGKLRYDKPVRRAADFIEGGAPNVLGFAALEAAIVALLSIGRLRIFSHVQIYLDALDNGLRGRGFASARMPDMARRSGILSVRPPPGISSAALAGALGRRGVAVSTPDGYLRFSPHWPNAHSEVPRVLDTLDEALREVRGEVAPTIVDLAEQAGISPAARSPGADAPAASPPPGDRSGA